MEDAIGVSFLFHMSIFLYYVCLILIFYCYAFENLIISLCTQNNTDNAQGFIKAGGGGYD